MIRYTKRFALSLCLISSLSISTAQAVGGIGNFLYDYCLPNNITASLCLKAAECFENTYKNSTDSSASVTSTNHVWNYKLYIAGGAAVVVLAAVLQKTVPWVYGGIARRCSRLFGGKDWSRTTDFLDTLPSRLTNKGNIRERIVAVRNLLLANNFQENPLSYEKGIFPFKLHRLAGYRYQATADDLLQTIDLTVNSDHVSSFYQTLGPDDIQEISPTIERIFKDYEGSRIKNDWNWRKCERDYSEKKYIKLTSNTFPDLEGIIKCNPIVREVSNILKSNAYRNFSIEWFVDLKSRTRKESVEYNDGDIIVTISSSISRRYPPSFLIRFYNKAPNTLNKMRELESSVSWISTDSADADDADVNGNRATGAAASTTINSDRDSDRDTDQSLRRLNNHSSEENHREGV